MYVYVWRSSERGILQVREIGLGLDAERLLEAVEVALLVQEAVVLEDRLRVRPPALGLEVLDVALPIRREGPPEGPGCNVLRESRGPAGAPQDFEDPSAVGRLLWRDLEQGRLRAGRRGGAAQYLRGLVPGGQREQRPRPFFLFSPGPPGRAPPV